jgi:hypothetical protein
LVGKKDGSMRVDLTGRRLRLAVTRGGMLAAIALIGAGLSACTTTEGTNAMTDPATFEREVMTPTLVGIGLIDKPPAKPDPTNPRAPLVMPKNTAVLPPPTQDADVALLPADSDKVQINTAGLTQEDLSRLRNARVVDLHTVDGRPLSEAEARKLTARMKAARLAPQKRSIFLPPEEYFTTVKGGENLVCLAADGDLVAVNDPNCPPEIRRALLSKKN